MEELEKQTNIIDKSYLKYFKIALAILLLLCLADMPYGYYQLVRFIGMVIFGILTYSEKDNQKKGWFVFWLASAILINPIIKISLGRSIWNIVDILWSITLFISIKVNRGLVNGKRN